MVKFAKITKENKVECVLLLDDMYDNDAISANQQLSGNYVQVTDTEGNFVTNVTKIPSIGASYINGYFVDPKPFASWVLNLSTYQWEPPVPQPNPEDIWIEESLSWYPLSADYSTATPTATYTPTTETIESLDTRLSAIESNTISDVATSSSLLTLVADLANRITILEGNN